MLRFLTSLALALMLALTSQSMAVARGASAATGHMVLCTGSGPVAVYFDAEGEPTSAPHICPDAAMHVLVGAALPDARPSWVLVHSGFETLAQRAQNPRLSRATAQSRAPPSGL